MKALQDRGAIVDATYTKLKDRRQLIKLCRHNGNPEIIAYWFNLPLEICLERNAQRQRVVPEQAVRKVLPL
jgi:predicted kinase